MKLLVEWDNEEKVIIRMTFAGKWTWHDFYQANLEAVAMMKTVEHPVHFLVDFRQSQGIPGDSPFIHARNAITAIPDNWDIMVVVTNNPLLEHLVKVFRITFYRLGAKTFTVTSLDDGYELIAQQDSLV